MSGFYTLENKEVIHIKVKKYDGKTQPEYKKFSIDPQITSFEMLQIILARAFEIECDFSISYLARDTQDQEVYLSMLSDWDMDAAFQCASEPFLRLRIDLQPFEELEEEWDVIDAADVPQPQAASLLKRQSILGSITGSITHNLSKTVDSVQRAMGFKHPDNEVLKPIKAPMSETEFSNYLDSAGVMIKPDDFRYSVYQGGIEPSLRQVAWRHLLNIFPAGMSRTDRLKYLKEKEREYQRLRDEWREKLRNSTAVEEVEYVVNMVKKDVLRTDRSHDFFSGSDENENTLSLLRILVTYALTHPDVSYCQGMSDLASPLLITQKNEGRAYICFCSLMKRLCENFATDGSAIMTKFRHLSELLYAYDPDLYTHLQQNSAGDMLFCYRWFLLELKREFPLNDALYVLEVMWATLPANSPDSEIALADPGYSSQFLSTCPCSPASCLQHDMYTKLLAMRRVGALYYTAQSTNPITNSTPRASANNNCSTESTPQFCNLNITGSIVSSVNTFTADGEYDETDFPKLDNSVTSSVQRTSESVGHILQKEHLCEDCDNENRDHHVLDNIIKVYGCNNDIIHNDNTWALANSNCSCNTRSEPLERGKYKNCQNCMNLDNGPPIEMMSGNCQNYMKLDNGVSTDMMDGNSQNFMNLDNRVPTEMIDRFNIINLSCELNTGRRSWSLSSDASESSVTDNQQTQFTVSLDSNSNNSGDISSVTAEANNFVSSTCTSELEPERSCMKYVKSESDILYPSRIENNHGRFQGMKEFVISPRHQHLSSTWKETDSFPLLSPRRSSSVASRQLTLHQIMSPKTNRTGLTKNMSDSHISDCQEATEEFGNLGTSCSSIATNPPIQDPTKLPQPEEFGAGNPFLMFLCLTMLIQHRETILSEGLCYEEIAMHFDRLVRKHNANRVLHYARQMYTEYLRVQKVNTEEEKDNNGYELGIIC